jgi:glycosyltransferase involved in cell wall biosynthesis
MAMPLHLETDAALAGIATVIIPTLNEAETIAAVIAAVPRPLAREVIVADGGSTDATVDRAAAAGARVLAAGRGYGRACAAGAAEADPASAVLVFLDGDGADRADLMARLVGPIAAGTHDFVLATRTRGEREKGAMAWHQVLAGRLAGAAMRALYGVPYTDMCAFRAIRRDALAALNLREAGYGWNLEMQMLAAHTGQRILEIPLPYRRRAGGRSKVAGSLTGSLRAGWRITATLLRVAFRRGN